MDHLFLRLPGGRVLLTRPHLHPDGRGRTVGYGLLVHYIDETFLVAGAVGARVHLVRPRLPMNRALYDLVCDDVGVVGQERWRVGLLRLLWHVSGPFRFGVPHLWFQQQLAQLVLPRAYRVLSASRHLRKDRFKAFKRRVASLRAWSDRVTSARVARTEAAWRDYIRLANRRARKGDAVSSAPRLPEHHARRAAAAARELGIGSGAPHRNGSRA